ncbi:hypothetical protein PENTCL1PPCAC_4030, partial [Pristionchus entomophagus]
QCELAEQFYYNDNLHALQWVHFLVSFASVILCMYTARKYVHKTLFESSTNELIIAVYIFCTIHGGAVAFLQILHLSSRYTASIPCLAQISNKFCILRMIATSSISGFCILHAGITAQRFESTFNYSFRVQKITARVFFLAASVIFAFIAYHKEPLDGFSPYCSAFIKCKNKVLMLNLYVLLGLDIVNDFATLALWRYNKIMLKKERAEYNLEKTFHRKQNIIAIKQFFPVNFIHPITYVALSFLYERGHKSRKIGFEWHH